MADSTGYPELDSLLPRLAALASLDLDALEQEEIALLGRKAGVITAALKGVATRAPEERRPFGAAVNALKVQAEAAVAARRAELDAVRATSAGKAPRPQHAGAATLGRRRPSGLGSDGGDHRDLS